MTPTTRIGIGGEEAHPFLQQRRIWLLDVLGGVPPRPLTDAVRYRDEEAMWSADGSHILFGRMDYEGHASLWLIESSGANPRQVCRLAFSHLAPAVDDWFGYYGYVDWRSAFDWRR